MSSLLMSSRRWESGPGFGIPSTLPFTFPPWLSDVVPVPEPDGVGVPAWDGAALEEVDDDSPLASFHLRPPYAKKGLRNCWCASLFAMKLLSDLWPLTRKAQSGKLSPPPSPAVPIPSPAASPSLSRSWANPFPSALPFLLLPL